MRQLVHFICIMKCLIAPKRAIAVNTFSKLLVCLRIWAGCWIDGPQEGNQSDPWALSGERKDSHRKAMLKINREPTSKQTPDSLNSIGKKEITILREQERKCLDISLI